MPWQTIPSLPFNGSSPRSSSQPFGSPSPSSSADGSSASGPSGLRHPGPIMLHSSISPTQSPLIEVNRCYSLMKQSDSPQSD